MHQNSSFSLEQGLEEAPICLCKNISTPQDMQVSNTKRNGTSFILF